jgi:large subunit ribosomal protein L11
MSWKVVSTPTDVRILKELGVQKGSGTPNKDKLAKKLTQAQLQKIAEEKAADMNTNRIESVKKMVAGTARSMGVEIEG